MKSLLIASTVLALSGILITAPARSDASLADIWGTRLGAALDPHLKPLAITAETTGGDIVVHAQPACAPTPDSLAIVLKAVPIAAADEADLEPGVLFSPTGAITEATALFAEPLTAVTITVFEGAGHHCESVPAAAAVIDKLQGQ